jgi:pilus assembly protein CpaB
MRTKFIVLVVAVLLGLFAAFAAVNYIESARSTIEAEEQPVEVLVAQQDLPAGLSAEELSAEEYVALVEMPRRYVADGAVSSFAVIEGKLLTVPLTKGEQITSARFSLPTEAGLSFAVPEDYVAVALPNTAPRGVAGLIRPGDSVVVYATFEPGTELEEAVTKLILPKARVLAVGTRITYVPETNGRRCRRRGIVDGRTCRLGLGGSYHGDARAVPCGCREADLRPRGGQGVARTARLRYHRGARHAGTAASPA